MAKLGRGRFEKLVRLFQYRQLETVGIEAGHIYIDETPNQEHIRGFEIGADLLRRLATVEIKPVRIVFIDDYNPSENRLCKSKYFELANKLGFPPDEVVNESTMVPGAEEIIAQLTELDLTTEYSEDGQFTTKYNVRLRHGDGRLSCLVLDAAFHLQRFNKYDFNVTILPSLTPKHYTREQRRVRQILRLLGFQDLPLANIFFKDDGVPNLSLP